MEGHRASDDTGEPRVDTLIAGVVHEMRNVLFAISVNLEILESGPQDAEESGEVCRGLRGEQERLERLANDLVELGRMAPESLEPAPLEPVLDAAVQACGDVAKESGLVIECAPAPPRLVRMERDRLVLAFERLIANACHHGPRGTPVRIEIEPFAIADREWIRCSVHDQGSAGTPRELERSFEPFAGRSTRGDRLGLAIVRRIVAQHGGRTAADAEAGRGTRLLVELPCA